MFLHDIGRWRRPEWEGMMIYDRDPVKINGVEIYPIDIDGDIEIIDGDGCSIYVSAKELVAHIHKWGKDLNLRIYRKTRHKDK